MLDEKDKEWKRHQKQVAHEKEELVRQYKSEASSFGHIGEEFSKEQSGEE